MTVRTRETRSAAGLLLVAALLAGCSSTGSNTANLNTIGAPQQLAPVQNSTVQQSSLPAIGATGTPAPGLSGQPVLGGVQSTPMASVSPGMTTPGLPPTTSYPSAPLAPTAPTAPGSSIVSLDPLAQPTAGGMSTGPEGTWNVVSGSATCRLNLPMTAKTGTNYYRASAPGCAVPSLAAVTGWQQVGSQLQLYDDNGNIAAFMTPNAGRYVGTISGGQTISMAR
jgi:hypothetical protein